VEEVGLGQCDASCQHCFWVFSFSDDKVEPVDCRSFPVSQRAFCGGWSQTPGPLKAQSKDRGREWSGGRGPQLGVVGRDCKVSVGERAVQDQAPLDMSREERGFSSAQVGRAVPARVCGAVLFLWCLLCCRPSSGLDVLVALCTQEAHQVPWMPPLGPQMPVLIG